MVSNPRLRKFVPGSQVGVLKRELNKLYTNLHRSLQVTFNGHPEKLGHALGLMFSIDKHLKGLVFTPLVLVVFFTIFLVFCYLSSSSWSVSSVGRAWCWSRQGREFNPHTDHANLFLLFLFCVCCCCCCLVTWFKNILKLMFVSFFSKFLKENRKSLTWIMNTAGLPCLNKLEIPMCFWVSIYSWFKQNIELL